MDHDSRTHSIDEREKWISFARKLLDLCVEIQRAANVQVTEKGFHDPKVLALALLGRTYLNLKGVIAVGENGLAVEARILTRSCYENLIFVARLVEKGDEFVDQMIDDDLKSTRSRGEFVLEDISDLDPLGEEMAGQLHERLQQLKDRRPRARFINTKDAAKYSVIKPAYLFYSQLSGDSAHPSITALKRHLIRLVENGEIVLGLDIHPTERGTEVADTVNIACNAVLGTCVAVNQILGFTEASSLISSFAAEYQEIAGWRKPPNVG